MKLHFHGVSYDRSPHFLVDTYESKITGIYRGKTYKIHHSTVITPNPVRNLKYRDLKYRGVSY